MHLFPISDVHIGMREAFFNEINIKQALGFINDYDDLVMCACGDIGDRMDGILWLQKVLEIFPKLQVVYLPGNHEFYNANMDILPYDLARAGERTDRLHVLDGTYIFAHTIGDVTFVGATLWTNFNNGAPAVMNEVQRGLNDYRYIRTTGDFKPLTTNRILNEHGNQLKSITKRVNKAEGKVVCMSHHSPIIINEGHADGLSYGYCSDLTQHITEEFNKVPTYWFSGHTHSSHIKRIEFPQGETQFISNQMGYPIEFNSGYTTACVLEI